MFGFGTNRILRKISHQLKLLGELMDADIKTLLDALAAQNDQLTKNNTDIVAAIGKIQTGGLSAADRAAVQAAAAAAAAQTTALKAQDDALEAALNPAP